MFAADELAAVLAPFDRARPLPARAYVDPSVLDLERRRLFPRHFRAVAAVADLDGPGSYLRTALGGRTIVLLTDRDGRVRALRDGCIHRGAPVFPGDRGVVDELRCNYHGFRYDLTGRLVEAPHLPIAITREECSLDAATVATAFGLWFVREDASDDRVAALAAGAPPPFGAVDGARLVVVHRARWRVGANWKLVVENFQESHHFGTVHPLLEARTPSARAESLLGDGDWLGGRMPIAPAFETVSHAGRIDERPFLVPAEARGAVVDALLFPLTMLSLQPDYLLTYRLEPTAVDETFVEHELLVDRDARGPFGDVVRLWAEVHDQDRRACESQTRAIAGGAWRPRFYATCEDGVHAFDARIAAFYRAELASDASARAAGASTQVGTDSAAASVGPFDRRV